MSVDAGINPKAVYSRLFLAKGAVLMMGAFGVTQAIRLVSNVVLARLLAPELFGIMFIVNSLRTGAELITDLGVGQNIVHNPNAEDPDFYNTAWTLQIVRGLLLWIVCLGATFPLSYFYGTPVLNTVMPVASLAFVLSGFTSVSRYLLQKRIQLLSLSLFEIVTVLISSIAQVGLAVIDPTIWSLVFGSLIGYAVPMVGSYFLIAGLKMRFFISKKYAHQILHFGIWIFVSSIVYFFASNFDRLYLAKIIPLGLLGVYGIARNISELLGLLAGRMGNGIIFPLIAALSQLPRSELRERLSSSRLQFLFLAAVGFSLFAAAADLLINVIYDHRYREAGWMLPVLIAGAWFSTLCSVNEATLLGLGKPAYGALANSLKFAFLVVALPIGFLNQGARGGVLVVAAADLCRYLPIFLGQRREKFSFGMQDALLTVVMVGLLAVWECLRWSWGFGTSFDGWAL